MAAGRHFEIYIYKNLNNFRTAHPILTKFGTELRLNTTQTPDTGSVKVAIFQNPRWPPTKT